MKFYIMILQSKHYSKHVFLPFFIILKYEKLLKNRRFIRLKIEKTKKLDKFILNNHIINISSLKFK